MMNFQNIKNTKIDTIFHIHLCICIYIISPVAHKETIKLYNEKLNNTINKKNVQEEKLELFLVSTNNF